MEDHEIAYFEKARSTHTMMGLYKHRLTKLQEALGYLPPLNMMSTFRVWDNGYMAGYSAGMEACRDGKVVGAKLFTGKLPGDEGYGQEAETKGET